jgi:hypothetical protein
MAAQDDSEVKNVSQFSAEVSAHSHLVFSKLKQYNEVVFWERPELPDINPTDFDVIYSLSVADRMDNIAASVYGDPVLWWVLALANNIRLQPLRMNPGYLFRLVDGGEINRVIRGNTK